MPVPSPQPPPSARRIGVVLHDFAAGGSERVMIHLANRWSAAGRRVVIWCGSAVGPARRLVAETVEVRETAPAFERGHGSRRRLGRAIAAALRPGEVDLLVAPGNFHMPVLAALAEATPGRWLPLVCKISNPLVRPDLGPLARAAFAWRKRRDVRAIDLLIAMSPALEAQAAAILGRGGIACVAEPLILPDIPHGPASDTPLVIVAGRLVPQKRMDLALRAFAALGRPARLVVLGDGPERDALERLAKRLGLAQRVTFAGHVAEIAPWLARADAFLATSRYEGFPAVLIEAIAAGVPVVTTRSSPAIPEILGHPSFGAIAEATPVTLARTLAAVLGAPRPDAARRASLRARHDPDRVAAAWLDRLDRVVAGGD